MSALDNIASLKSYFCSELILIVGILALVFMSFRKGHKEAGYLLPTTLAFLVMAAAAIFALPGEAPRTLFMGAIVHDPFGDFFKLLIIATAAVIAVMSASSRDLDKTAKAEYYAFLLTLTLGLNILSVANDLVMIYLAIEIASIVSYILAGYMGSSRRSEEAALKYVLYGGMASGIMIFGMSLLYGLGGSLNLTEIRMYFDGHATDRLVLFITFILILAGLGYKMAIAPFHMWAPDTYEGAPLPVTAFLSVASKAAGFAVTLRFFSTAFLVKGDGETWVSLKSLDWQTLIVVLSALTMTIGNFVALHQTNIKRFLAYSSVAHAGYLLMGLAAQNALGIEGTLFYFLVYFIMNLGGFFVAALMVDQFGTEEISDFKGLAKKGTFSFLISVCFSIFLLSLAGIPPFAGFIAKWYIFSAAIKANLIGLAVVGVINSVVSLFYYLRIVKFMLIDEPNNEHVMTNRVSASSAIIFGFAIMTLYFGLFFSPLVNWTKTSASLFY